MALIENEGVRAQEQKHCSLCQSEGVLLYRDLRDRLFRAPGRWSFRHCRICNFIWLDPQPIPDDSSKLYIEYFTHQEEISRNKRADQGESSWEKLKNIVLLGRHREREEYRLMFLSGERPGRLLDVGCGDGRFLSLFSDLGWEVIGIEPDAQAAIVAKERGLQIIVGKVEEIDLTPNSFDAITLSHVIEHVHNPIGLLRRCFNLLKLGGKLAITTPNIKSLGHRLFKESWLGLDPPRHFYLFSPRSLKRVVESSDLGVVIMNTGARLASGVFEAGLSIRATGQRRGQLYDGLNKFGHTVARSMFVAFEFWLNMAFGNLGEEIGILAVRRR